MSAVSKNVQSMDRIIKWALQSMKNFMSGNIIFLQVSGPDFASRNDVPPG